MCVDSGVGSMPSRTTWSLRLGKAWWVPHSEKCTQAGDGLIPHQSEISPTCLILHQKNLITINWLILLSSQFSPILSPSLTSPLSHPLLSPKFFPLLFSFPFSFHALVTSRFTIIISYFFFLSPLPLKPPSMSIVVGYGQVAIYDSNDLAIIDLFNPRPQLPL